MRIKPDVNLRDQLDVDPVDFLNFVIGLRRAFDLDIPEADYPSLYRLDSCVDDLGERVAVEAE